jgi:uncharacterized membrane protein YfcA
VPRVAPIGIWHALFLVGVAFVAGTVDAIGGGGGLLTVPALLAVGLPPHLALGTNKGQSTFGSAAALLRYARSGLIPWRRARWLFPAGLLGALGGARLVLFLRPELLEPLILALLVAVAAFLAFRRRRAQGAQGTPTPLRERLALLAALAIGAYDGFFGPGTGTFLIVAFVALLGLSLPQASAEAKVVNCAANVAALAMFSWNGVVLWTVALPMAGAQLLAGTLGAHLAIRGGDVWVRRVVLGVVLVLVLKLGLDLLSP